MKEEHDNPALVPFDDRHPSLDNLLRRPEDLTEEQFALLAAEWAEGEMDADSIAEMESVFTAYPHRKEFAESLRLLRLSPGNEKWSASKELIKYDIKTIRIRRGVLLTLSAAAAIIAFIFLSPFIREKEIETIPLSIVEGPVIHRTTIPVEPVGLGEKTVRAEVKIISAENRLSAGTVTNETDGIIRIEPVTMERKIEKRTLITSLDAAELRPVSMPEVNLAVLETEKENNWIIGSIDGLYKGDNKPVNGYTVAGSIIKGVNKVLGWELSLEKVVNPQGEPVEVNFNSSLLSFSAPVKKTDQ